MSNDLKWSTKVRGWLRLQRCKHMTDELSSRGANSAALPHLHMVPWSILTTVAASVLEAALKVAIFLNLNAHTTEIQFSAQCVLLWLQCLHMKLSVMFIIATTIFKYQKILIYLSDLTFKNSLWSTCSFPSTSSILKAIWNPVRGSATVMHCQLSELYLNTTENLTWLNALG